MHACHPWCTQVITLSELKAKLVPLQTRIQQIVAGHICMIISSRRPYPLGDSLRRLLANPEASQHRVLA